MRKMTMIAAKPTDSRPWASCAHLPLKLHAEIDALRPEIGGAEERCGPIRGGRGRRDLVAIHDQIDLIAGAGHAAPVHEVVTDECPPVGVELVANRHAD